MGSLAMTFVGYAGSAIAFVFAVLSIACGLYYLAELVEEYTVQTKRIIKGLTLSVVVLHLLLWLLDGLPFTKIMFSLLCHAVYSLNLSNFPNISLYFARHYYAFSSIASFFGICVWLVPFSYFISLSANDNTLPNFDKTNKQQQKKNGILKSIFGTLLNKKENTPVIVETPRYTGFGSNSSLAAASGYQSQDYSSSSSTMHGSAAYPGYNPATASTLTPGSHGHDSQPSSRNMSRSNSPFAGAAATGTSSGVQKGYMASDSYGGSTGTAVYSQHSTSTLSSRF